MKIILITGVIGSGKDHYVKEYIRTHPNEKIKHLKFAASLRDVTEGMYNIPKGDESAYEAFKAIPANRKFMINLGSNLKRVYGEDFFANGVLRKINELRLLDNYTIIISDFRFPIEFWTLANYFDTDKPEITVIFKNYKSERYQVNSNQVTEKMAIWLLNEGFNDQDVITKNEFAKLLCLYEFTT